MDADVTVREIMTREYVGVSESDGVAEAVELMLEESADGVVVLRGSDPVGMLTAADALALVTSGRDPGDTDVGAAMSGTVPSVAPDASVAEAAGAMADAGIGSLLAVDGDDLVGVVSERDVVRAAATLADRSSVGSPAGPAGQEPVAAAAEDDATGTGGRAEGEYSAQSVCESCGSFTPDLRNFNGQLICGDCREV